jgi:aminoarabinose transferase-like protein
VYDRWMHQAHALQPVLIVASAVVLGSTVLAAAIRRPSIALVVMAGGLAVGLASVEPARRAYRSYAALGTIVRLRAAEADRVVTYGTYLQGLPFYARRHTTLVSSLGELRFGATFSEGRALVWSDKRLIRAWNGRRRIFLIIEPEAWGRLRHRLQRPPAVLAFEHGHVLMTNAPLGIRAVARPGARVSARPPPPAAAETAS